MCETWRHPLGILWVCSWVRTSSKSVSCVCPSWQRSILCLWQKFTCITHVNASIAFHRRTLFLALSFVVCVSVCQDGHTVTAAPASVFVFVSCAACFRSKHLGGVYKVLPTNCSGEVDDGSLVATWNASQSNQVVPGNLLRSVNGQSDPDGICQDGN